MSPENLNMADVITVGRRVYDGREHGIIVAVHGIPGGKPVRTLAGFCGMCWGATVDVGFDNGHALRRVSEGVVRGLPWKILPEVAGADEVAAAVLYCEAEAVRLKAQEELKEEKRKKRLAELPGLFPHLKPGGSAAENIKRALKKAFPEHRFSVRTSRGGSVNVCWELGPTEADVRAVAGGHTLGHFDGMTDSYEYDEDRAFTDVFGGERYIFWHRDIPKEVYALVAGLLAEKYGEPVRASGEYWDAKNGQMIDRETREAFAACSLRPGELPVGLELVGHSWAIVTNMGARGVRS